MLGYIENHTYIDSNTNKEWDKNVGIVKFLSLRKRIKQNNWYKNYGEKILTDLIQTINPWSRTPGIYCGAT